MSESIQTQEVKPKVLVVDDERMNLNALHGLLRDQYQVMAAISGEQALKAALSGQPDLILLDINMPEMDGLQFLEAVRTDAVIGKTVFIMLTGSSDKEIVQKAAVAGIPVICAVSAPSDLAVEAAERLGLTLVGFLRADGFNVYTGRERIDLA